MLKNIVKMVEIDKYNLAEENQMLPLFKENVARELKDQELLYNELSLTYKTECAIARENVVALLESKKIKATIDAIGSELDRNNSLIDLKRRLLNYEAEINYLKGISSALDTKRYCLNNLVSLYIKDYYGNENVDGKFNLADKALENNLHVAGKFRKN